MGHVKKFGFAWLGISLLFVIIKVVSYLWKCLKIPKAKSNQRINFVEMWHVFENSKCIRENPNLIETTEIEDQNTSSDRMIQFLAWKLNFEKTNCYFHSKNLKMLFKIHPLQKLRTVSIKIFSTLKSFERFYSISKNQQSV